MSDNLKVAFLNKENIVISVLVFESFDISLLEQVKEHLSANSYKSCSEYGMASVDGDFYNDKFYPPKQYSSWIRNEELGIWEAPIAYPNDGEQYVWDENSMSWLLLPPSN